jgi:hypothetical protein
MVERQCLMMILNIFFDLLTLAAMIKDTIAA